jgi:uncharacterized protein DUF3298
MVQIPQLQGSDDLRVQTLNQILNETIQKEMKLFRDDFLLYGAKPLPSGSSMDGSYILTAQYADIWSFKLDFLYYYDNAKVPVHFSIPVNYDLGQGKILTLSDLFLQNSNYLELISEYCITELGKRDPIYPVYGATYPQAGNYDNWNIMPNGLMIIFNPTEVAPAEAGLQTVVVPFTYLQGIIDPEGTLDKINQ